MKKIINKKKEEEKIKKEKSFPIFSLLETATTQS